MRRITTKEAARILRVTYNHVCRLCANGTLEAERVGRMYLLRRSDVESYKKKRASA